MNPMITSHCSTPRWLNPQLKEYLALVPLVGLRTPTRGGEGGIGGLKTKTPTLEKFN